MDDRYHHHSVTAPFPVDWRGHVPDVPLEEIEVLANEAKERWTVLQSLIDYIQNTAIELVVPTDCKVVVDSRDRRIKYTWTESME